MFVASKQQSQLFHDLEIQVNTKKIIWCMTKDYQCRMQLEMNWIKQYGMAIACSIFIYSAHCLFPFYKSLPWLFLYLVKHNVALLMCAKEVYRHPHTINRKRGIEACTKRETNRTGQDGSPPYAAPCGDCLLQRTQPERNHNAAKENNQRSIVLLQLWFLIVVSSYYILPAIPTDGWSVLPSLVCDAAALNDDVDDGRKNQITPV